MGLPSQDRVPRSAGSNNYGSEDIMDQRRSTYGTPPESSPLANGQSGSSHRPYGSIDAGASGPSNVQERPSRALESTSSPAGRERSRPNGSRRPSGAQRTCGKCGRSLTGQFVRALGDTYHLECFTCHDCDKIVASKFFPVPDQPPNQYPLCETDYFKRLDLLCFACGGALRGSYITALERKYHIEHFTCSVCPTVFGAQDSYYEHEGSVYCHYHYSTRFAQKCNGCQTAILKQFVEIFRNGQNQHWHPECYMIHKYWNVRLHQSGQTSEDQQLTVEDASEELRKVVRTQEEKVEEKVHWIWQTLSGFEEKSATCISDMLLHVSNGAYMDGVGAAKKFITHVDVLFHAADDLDLMLQNQTGKGLSYSRESKLLCKKVVAFFQLLAESQDTGVRRLGVTQDLLSLVTGLAHYLKLLIRICLQGSLKLERETGRADGLTGFLQDISQLDDRLDRDNARDSRADFEAYVSKSADTCGMCNKPVEEKAFRREFRSLHTQCMVCAKCGRDLSTEYQDAMWSESLQKVYCDQHASLTNDAELGSFREVTRLQQYVHLLRVAHARLLATLMTSGALPHTSDDPNLTDYDSNRGQRLTPSGQDDPPGILRSNTRSRSYAGRGDSSTRQQEQDQSYEDTMGDIKRLRSTRMDKHLSTTMRKARTSRIIDGPQGMRPDSADGTDRRRHTGGFQIVEDREQNGDVMQQLNFGNGQGMTLDDIPRFVQAQQTKEQRPNASKYARGPMVPQEPKPRLINGHTRELSGGEGDRLAPGETKALGTKKYFSELTALEYFIVRHVAVLSMEPLLEGHFNQEELLDLIETKKGPTFWSKFGKAFQPKEKRSKANKTAIFGVPLEQLLERDYEESTDGVGPGSLKIPSLVQEAVAAMKTMDMSVEGVFRKNGNIKRLNDVKEQIDTKGSVEVDLTKENPVQVAALLKKFLRELPDPLLTFKLHKLWITSQKITDDDRRRRVLHLTCCLLPKPHRDTMEVLFTFLNWVSSFSHVDEESGSKMDIHNLATVITPNVLNTGKDNAPVDDSFLAIEAVHSLIECNEAMCEVPEDLQLILNDSSLFSKDADITTKEILKRYGDRAKAPQVTQQNPSSDPSESPAPRSREGRSSAPVVTRVDTDPHQANAWQNESSVRHVQGPGVGGMGANDMGTPQLPYANPSASTESHGSPSRSSYRGSTYDKQRVMGMA